jgi:hypothetical protein
MQGAKGLLPPLCSNTLQVDWLWYVKRFAVHKQLSLLGDSAQPVEAFIHSLTSGGAASLDSPLSPGNRVQVHLICHHGGRHGSRHILFVGKYQDISVLELLSQQQLLQLFGGLYHSLGIVGINYENEA